MKIVMKVHRSQQLNQALDVAVDEALMEMKRV